MARDYIATIERIYDAWAHGDFTVGAEVIDPNFVFVVSDASPQHGVYHGAEGVATFFHELFEVFEGLTVRAERMRLVGDTVLVTSRRHATGAGGGAAAEDESFHGWTFRGTTLIRLEIFATEADALRALGEEA